MPDEPIAVPSPLLTAKQVALWLGTSESELSQLRFYGRGPAYIKLGRAIRYDREDVQKYLDQNRHS